MKVEDYPLYQEVSEIFSHSVPELLALFCMILEAKEMRKEILVILHDLFSAFDMVSHKILLEKLRTHDFSDLAINWIGSYIHQ